MIKFKQLNLYKVTYTVSKVTTHHGDLGDSWGVTDRSKMSMLLPGHSTRQVCEVVRKWGVGDNKANIRAKIVQSLGLVVL